MTGGISRRANRSVIVGVVGTAFPGFTCQRRRQSALQRPPLVLHPGVSSGDERHEARMNIGSDRNTLVSLRHGFFRLLVDPNLDSRQSSARIVTMITAACSSSSWPVVSSLMAFRGRLTVDRSGVGEPFRKNTQVQAERGQPASPGDPLNGEEVDDDQGDEQGHF